MSNRFWGVLTIVFAFIGAIVPFVQMRYPMPNRRLAWGYAAAVLACLATLALVCSRIPDNPAPKPTHIVVTPPLRPAPRVSMSVFVLGKQVRDGERVELPVNLPGGESVVARIDYEHLDVANPPRFQIHWITDGNPAGWKEFVPRGPSGQFETQCPNFLLGTSYVVKFQSSDAFYQEIRFEASRP